MPWPRPAVWATTCPSSSTPRTAIAWPWAWYLRDYHDVRYTTPNAPGFRGPEGAVLLVHQSQTWPTSMVATTPRRPTSTAGGSTRPTAASRPVRSSRSSLIWSSLHALGNFFLYRRDAATNTGSVDGVAFFPESLAAYDKLSSISKPPAEPVLNVDGRTTIGKPGSGRGELLCQPP